VPLRAGEAVPSRKTYKLGKLLGKGSFGAVYLCEAVGTGRQFVMKRIGLANVKAKEQRQAYQEVKLLQRLHHEYIVSYQDSFLDKRTTELCIVMQFCSGGDLHAALRKAQGAGRRISESTASRWLAQLTLALQHVHAAGIIHRDLKTQNVFLTEKADVKLGDFGVSRVLERPTDLAATTVGTPYYMAPEIFRKVPYSAKADMWALGCVLYEVLTLKHAFDANDMNGLAMKIVRGKYPEIPSTFTDGAGRSGAYSPDLREKIKALLNPNPEHRPSSTELLKQPLLQAQISRLLETRAGGIEPPDSGGGKPPPPPASNGGGFGGDAAKRGGGTLADPAAIGRILVADAGAAAAARAKPPLSRENNVPNNSNIIGAGAGARAVGGGFSDMRACGMAAVAARLPQGTPGAGGVAVVGGAMRKQPPQQVAGPASVVTRRRSEPGAAVAAPPPSSVPDAGGGGVAGGIQQGPSLAMLMRRLDAEEVNRKRTAGKLAAQRAQADAEAAERRLLRRAEAEAAKAAILAGRGNGSGNVHEAGVASPSGSGGVAKAVASPPPQMAAAGINSAAAVMPAAIARAKAVERAAAAACSEGSGIGGVAGAAAVAVAGGR